MIYIMIFFCIFIFFFVMYMVVKAAVNNSELLKEIKVLLLKSENDRNKN